MSIEARFVCFCDAPDCERGNAAGLDAMPTRADLRDAMKDDGWKRLGGKDYCPDCVVDVKKALAAESREGSGNG